MSEFVEHASSKQEASEQQPSEEESKGQEPQDQSAALDEGFVDLMNKPHLDETLPKVKTRTKAPTAQIRPTKLSNKRVSIKVSESQVKKGGFFSSDYILYKIDTEPLSWSVHRRDNEFYTLRTQLRNQFPHILVPPLPALTKKMTRKALDKREKQF